jgi:hypothetical protein
MTRWARKERPPGFEEDNDEEGRERQGEEGQGEERPSPAPLMIPSR